MLITILFSVFAAALGCAIGYLLSQNRTTPLREENARLKTEAELHLRDEERWTERLKEMELRFSQLSQTILNGSTDKLKTENSEQMKAVLQPLRDQLETLQKAVRDTNASAAGNRSSMETLVKQLMERTESMSKDAVNLTKALKGDSKVQGDWGEMILERMLEDSGLRRGEEYVVQEVHKGENGRVLRPDVIIRLPENRAVIVDSKVSLTAYAQYAEAEDELARETYAKLHVDSIRKHINELYEKNYAASVENSIGYVLMFMPNEAAYVLAMQKSDQLPMEAYRKNVLLISPTNLMMALQLAYNLWQKERQTQSVNKIIEQAARIYDKCVNVEESFTALGKSLEQASQRYGEAMNRFKDGNGNLTRQVHKLTSMGVTPKKRLTVSDTEEE